MSEKKEAKSKAAPAAPVKKSKVDPASKIKRGADGKKIMKVARGTERARRRLGLVQDWRTTKDARQMLPSKIEAATQATPA